MVLRATNTGVTSIIKRDGTIQQILPQHKEGTLTGSVQGYAGSTPYVFYGNVVILAFLIAMLGMAKLTQCNLFAQQTPRTLKKTKHLE